MAALRVARIIHHWISLPPLANFTSTLISRWLADGGGNHCASARTADISFSDFDNRSYIELAAGEAHEFTFYALDAAGNRRCLGGDYFETDLSGEHWKSRPPVTDRGDGSYSLRLQIHPDFTGEFNLTIILLFRSFEGLKFSPERFKFNKILSKFSITFNNKLILPRLRTCRPTDFLTELWAGRWTRHGGSDTCPVDDDGRYRCLSINFPCKRPWCRGPLGALESNGWVYSAHCSFRIFAMDSAWECLRGRWLFFWGDSNHVDTIRNLLQLVLGVAVESNSITRRFDRVFANPKNRSEEVRITNIFNGHWDETKNYLGLQSLKNPQFQRLILSYFDEERSPDVVILNSGLHDGVYWRSIRAFAEGAEFAAKFWSEIMNNLKDGGRSMPRVFYRTTIAVGGYARDLAFNPAKMEAFNGVFLEKLKEKGVVATGGVIDEFDMTFPWHYDNRCSDGVHYGRSPAKARWRDGEVGHHYFVDLMLGHVILNAVCNR